MMALDFDRYLLASDPDIECHVIRSAYTEWSSYCYLGFGSGANQRPSPTTDARWQHRVSDSSGKTPRIAINTRIFDPDPVDNELGWLEEDHVTRASYVGGRIGHDLSDMDDNTSTKRPDMCQHGDRKCGDKVLAGQRGPVLGLSGLRCHGAKNGLPLAKRLATETFPKCATWCQTKERIKSPLGRNGIGGRSVVELRETEVNDRVLVSKRSAIVTSSRLLLSAISDVIEECSSSEEDSSESEPTPKVSPSRRRKVSFADECGEALVTCRVFERDQSPIDFCITLTSINDDDTSGDDDDDDDDLSDPEADVTSLYGGSRKFSVLADDAYRHLNRDIDNLKKLIEKHRRYFDGLRTSNDVTKSNSDNQAACTGARREPDAIAEGRPEAVERPEVVADSGDDRSDNDDDVMCKGDQSQSQDDFNCNDDIRKDVVLPETDNRQDDFRCHFVNFDLNFVNSGSGNMVTLRELHVDRTDRCIVGNIRVQSRERGSVLFVRYTTDDWRTQDDVRGELASSTDDAFHFRISLDASHVSLDQITIEFAICYRTMDGRAEFWDNNGGTNYILDVCL